MLSTVQHDLMFSTALRLRCDLIYELDKQGNEIHLLIKYHLGQVLWTRSTPKLCPELPWFYLIKILKELCYAMLNLDLSICFISVSARIDFLLIFS